MWESSLLANALAAVPSAAVRRRKGWWTGEAAAARQAWTSAVELLAGDDPGEVGRDGRRLDIARGPGLDVLDLRWTRVAKDVVSLSASRTLHVSLEQQFVAWFSVGIDVHLQDGGGVDPLPGRLVLGEGEIAAGDVDRDGWRRAALEAFPDDVPVDHFRIRQGPA